MECLSARPSIPVPTILKNNSIAANGFFHQDMIKPDNDNKVMHIIPIGIELLSDFLFVIVSNINIVEPAASQARKPKTKYPSTLPIQSMAEVKS
jgi:hypothetical protein